MLYRIPRLVGLLLASTFAISAVAAPKIVFLTGDEEYRSEESMPMLAQILRRDFDFDISVGFSVDADGFVDPNANHSLTETEQLADADLLVLFLRFRRPDSGSFQHILDYLAAGKPVVAFRTSTHAFRFTPDSPHAAWGYQNDPEFIHSFAGGDLIRELVGQKWITHHGHFDDGAHPLTAIATPPDVDAHPILRGVKPFEAYSWLYHVEGGEDTLAGDPIPLLRGRALRSNHADNNRTDRFPLTNPVAWTKTHLGNPDAPARVFTTTLGHPYDFRSPQMRRFALQGILWALGREDLIPAEGVDATPVRPYAPNNSGFGRDKHKPGRHPDDFFPLIPYQAGKPNHPQPRFTDPRKFVPSRLPHALPAGSTIALVGGGLGERLQYHGHFETLLHEAMPDSNIRVRNLAQSGFTAGLRPHPSRISPWAFPGAHKFNPHLLAHRGLGHFPSPDEWLTIVGADVVLGFFGYSESFHGEAGLDNFRAELAAWIKHTRSRIYHGESSPRIVLVSPIAFEDRSTTDDLPDGIEENQRLAAYTAALLEIASKEGVAAIDAFHPSLEWFASATDYLTVNGVHLNASGYRVFSEFLAHALFGGATANEASPRRRAIAAAVADKNWLWDNDYRMRNGVHAHGRRWQPFGDQNYPEEIEKIRQMTDLRDKAIWAAARDETYAPDDTHETRPLSPTETNFDREITYLDEAQALEKFTTPTGFSIGLFASEEQFPDLANPVQLTFDNRGRLWVAVMPSYPHYQPGDVHPNDKLLILEDTDGDGRADRQLTFADGLHLPIGFALQPDGSVILSQQPKLIRLRDTNGDGRADEEEILLTGFDSHDTHHAIGAFDSGPDGALYMLEGIFLHSQVETPYGTERGVEANVWRFDPRTQRLEKFSAADYDNPWGITFDKWGQTFLADASNGRNYWLTPMSARLPHGAQHPEQSEFTTSKVRPTSGVTFVSSRHFPDEQQGDFLLANSIGFLGIKQHTVVDHGAGYTGELRQDLLASTDPNFRPVDLEFAPDGSLYVADWHNALVGHMQHSARDPNRDRQHGRIFRITADGRPLVSPPAIADASIDALLRALQEPELATRKRARRELRRHPADQVLPAVDVWLEAVSPRDPDRDRHLLEALWLHAGFGPVAPALLERCLTHHRFEVRAAALRVLRHQRHHDPDTAADWARRAAADEHPRVRAEAIALASWLDDKNTGADIFLAALQHPVDATMAHGVEAVFETLGDAIKQNKIDPALHPVATAYLAGEKRFVEPEAIDSPPVLNLSARGLELFELGREVYGRDAHCATCHQPDGRGLAGIYPPLRENEWVAGDDERLIKLVLKGLWGPIEVNGTTYDPANGVPPMTGFEHLLNDEEIAAVLTYVRTQFGAWGEGGSIDPAQVTAVRAAVTDQTSFYNVEDLLRQHPMDAGESADNEPLVYGQEDPAPLRESGD